MGIEIGILNWIQNLHTPAADAAMCFVTRLGDGGILWILLTVLLFLIPKTRKSGIILAAALCVDLVLCNGVLKHLFCRIRPCDVNTAVQLLIPRPGDFSFPSGHTAASFAAVAALYFAGAKKWWKITLPLAILMAFSRMYLYVHFPTDILGGAVLGITIGALTYVYGTKILKIKKE